ncbi:hypothetical protein L1987_83541 [Smallanthus sonchifolius]|uniref:Uncharacterized protein n=1 Tax=Smallanthus sonchifolius TaxID=185202 RepID=A0ACB8YGG4_9ASTR|nr:hypothetical protein L1987_83541 [Smallanthus sonchifolius]
MVVMVTTTFLGDNSEQQVTFWNDRPQAKASTKDNIFHYALEHESCTPSEKFDSKFTQSTIGKERGPVDTVMKATTQDLGFSQGKPVAVLQIVVSSAMQSIAPISR